MSIQPLPADVIAQIKSSIAITNLNSVVCELLKNSLDAGATKVDISVDHSKGNCIVEDDGLGISPVEFGENGSLGKLYREFEYLRPNVCLLIHADTSKLNTPSLTHGGRGTFLASLSAMSVLSIVSHHHMHRSHNMIIMHKSEVVSRQIPAPPQQHLTSFNHGTRVTVRDLFGNMPVRVKQRAIAAEKSRTNSKEWAELKYDIVALLLAAPSNVILTMRDSTSSQKLSIRPPAKFPSSSIPGKVQIPWVCSVLSQASFISPDEKDSWVAVGAATPKLKICGTISLDPCATKHAQFFSYGIQPLKLVDGQSILHDEINRLFGNSAFGNDEEIEGLEEAERQRRAKDQRFKTDGYTTKELKGMKKGVDRWPMFYINVQQSCPRPSLVDLDFDEILDDKGGSLGNILELLQAMVSEFLTRNHFRPKLGLGHRSKRTKSTSPSKSRPSRMRGSLGKDGKDAPRTAELKNQSKIIKATFDQFGTNVKLPSFRSSVPAFDAPFHTWSRVKSGIPASLKGDPGTSRLTEIQRPASAPLPNTICTPNTSRSSTPQPPVKLTPLVSKTGNIIRRPFDDVEIRKRRSHITTPKAPQTEELPNLAAAEDDEIMTWTNPITKVISLVNEQTGLTVPSKKPTAAVATWNLSLSSRQKLKATSSITEPSPWIKDILENWDNPIFAPAELPIPQVTFQGPDATFQDLLHCRHHHCSQVDIDRAFKDLSVGISGRISKGALSEAEVVSQVDKKFILIKLRTSRKDDQMLVLIDQHAADERIRIESLMEDFCTPPSSPVPTESSILTTALAKPLNFKVSLRDVQLLQKYRQHFANWGILYQIPQHNLAACFDAKGKPFQPLTVTSLPPSVLERCRLDPRLLIDLIRAELYKIDSQTTTSSSTTPKALMENTPWLERIHTCPQGLIDMLNSRACRSAIMFNDELSNEQCSILVKKLARCMFPFQCAHGRPSLVPLVDIGMGSLRGMGGLLAREDSGDFGSEMRRWREREKGV